MGQRTTMKVAFICILLMIVLVDGARNRKPKASRGQVNGPARFNLPNLRKIPSTNFECLENERYSNSFISTLFFKHDYISMD